MSGTFLFVLGVAWPALQLTPRAEAATFWSALVGFYGSSPGLLLAAAVGTRNSTPLNGLPAGASSVWEAIVNALLSGGAVAVLVTCVLLLRGLRRVEGRGG